MTGDNWSWLSTVSAVVVISPHVLHTSSPNVCDRFSLEDLSTSEMDPHDFY